MSNEIKQFQQVPKEITWEESRIYARMMRGVDWIGDDLLITLQQGERLMVRNARAKVRASVAAKNANMPSSIDEK